MAETTGVSNDKPLAYQERDGRQVEVVTAVTLEPEAAAVCGFQVGGPMTPEQAAGA